MSNKHKGSNAERELVKIFTREGWRAVRVAGSGVGEDSPCDIVAGKLGKKPYAIECKSSKKGNIYITKEQISDFVLFASIMGLNSVIAARFNREGWYFLNVSELKDTGKYFALSIKTAKEKGKKFSQFFE